MGLEIKLQGTVFDADHENAICEKILQIRAASLAFKISIFNCHKYEVPGTKATEGWTHPQRVTNKRLANRSPVRSCRLHVRDNAEKK